AGLAGELCRLGQRLRPAAGGDDRCALPGKGEGCRPADARSPSRDENDLPCETPHRWIPPSGSWPGFVSPRGRSAGALTRYALAWGAGAVGDGAGARAEVSGRIRNEPASCRALTGPCPPRTAKAAKARALITAGGANTHRHPSAATMTPESSIPATAPVAERPPHRAKARVRSPGSSKSLPAKANAAGAVSDAPPPWANRAASRTVKLEAKPPASEARPKTVTPESNERSMPKRSPTRPPRSKRPLNVIEPHFRLNRRESHRKERDRRNQAGLDAGKHRKG